MYKIVVVAILFCCVFRVYSQGVLEDFQKKWKNAATYTLAVADSMPAEKYDYRPTEQEMTFRQQLLHIVGNVMWLSSTYLGGEKFEKDLKSDKYSKAEVIEILQSAFAISSLALQQLKPEQLEEKVEFFAGPMNKRQILTLLNDHHTHHRGQLMVYLRLNGIKPPRYVGW